jgi:hypothetical protein
MFRFSVLASLVLAGCLTLGAPEAVETPALSGATAADPPETPIDLVTTPAGGAEDGDLPWVEEEPPAAATFALRRGETLAHFARWSEVPVEAIAAASGLDLAGDYPVGTQIRVPSADPSRVAELREQHHHARVEAYLASRGGAVTSDFYAVRTGDTAWSIARDTQAIPVWVLEAYNPSVDLDRLRPGQELMVPVLADVVVEVD